MDNTCYGGAAAVVDIGHRAGYGASGRDAAEERCNYVCHTLSHQFGVGVVAVANGSVGNSSAEQTLYGTQYSYGECHGQKVLKGVEGETGHYHVGQLCLNVKAVADGVYAFHAELALEHEYSQCTHQNTIQRTRNLVQHRYTLQYHGGEDDDEQRTYGNNEVPEIKCADILGIAYPLADKIAGGLQRNGYCLAAF